MNAALEALVAEGYDGMSIEGVAARAERRQGHRLPAMAQQGRARRRRHP